MDAEAEGYKMNIKVLKKDKNKLIFLIEKINPATANAVRRFAMNYVPTLAIDEVSFQKNSSALYDEIITHRLALIPIKTDLKSYNLPSECKCKGKGCQNCQLILTIKAKGPCVVYSSELKSEDPKAIPIIDKLPIVKLLKDQEIKAECTAVLGQGKDHMKFSPCHIWYRGYPELKITKDSDIKKALSKIHSGIIIQKGQGLEIKDITKWNEAVEEILENNSIEITSSQENFIFYLESWGQLEPKEILTKAIDIFDDKLDEFEKLVKKIK